MLTFLSQAWDNFIPSINTRACDSYLFPYVHTSRRTMLCNAAWLDWLPLWKDP